MGLLIRPGPVKLTAHAWTDAQMADFEFDPPESFDTNLEAFLGEMDALDEEMAAILRENISALADAVRNGERNPRSRSDFNAAVMQALDELLDQATGDSKE